MNKRIIVLSVVLLAIVVTAVTYTTFRNHQVKPPTITYSLTEQINYCEPKGPPSKQRTFEQNVIVADAKAMENFTDSQDSVKYHQLQEKHAADIAKYDICELRPKPELN